MPLPSETSGLGPQEPAERVAPSWTGWWAGTDPARTGSADGRGHPTGRAGGDDRDVDRTRRGPPAATRRRPALRRRHARPCAGACPRLTSPPGCASSRRPPSPRIPLRCRSRPRHCPATRRAGRPPGRRSTGRWRTRRLTSGAAGERPVERGRREPTGLAAGRLRAGDAGGDGRGRGLGGRSPARGVVRCDRRARGPTRGRRRPDSSASRAPRPTCSRPATSPRPFSR